MSYIEQLKKSAAKLEEIKAMTPEEAYTKGWDDATIPIGPIIFFAFVFISIATTFGYQLGAHT